MLGIMDLGIADSLTNMISKAYALDDRESARNYYATAVWMTTGLSTILGLVALLVWPHIPWKSLLHLSDAGVAREASLCVAVGVAFFLISLPLNLINRVLSGYQQTQVTNYFNLLSSVLALVAILVAVHVRLSIVGLMMIYSSSLLAGSVGSNLWVHLRNKRWLRPTPRLISISRANELLNSGVGFFILQVAGLIAFNSDNLIITHFLGAAEVAPYSVTWRLAGYSAVLQTAIFPSLWPAYSEAYARRDFIWVRRTYWRAVRFALGSTTLAVAGLALFGRSLIRWYIAPSAVPTRSLLLTICLWTLINSVMDLQGCLLIATNRVRLQGTLSAIATVANILISIYLVQRIGTLGVIFGTILSYASLLIIPQAFMVHRVLYKPVETPPLQVQYD
jgi:O-antigen/teichoic acid export membrane protein